MKYRQKSESFHKQYSYNFGMESQDFNVSEFLNFWQLVNSTTVENSLGSETNEMSERELHILERQQKCLAYGLSSKHISTGEKACPLVFDGWSCWNETKAGSVAIQPCPSFIEGFDPDHYAFKECLPDGTWFRHPESEKVWSNYTKCVGERHVGEFLAAVNIYEAGYTISLIALVVALTIFYIFRLDCARIRIHKQLFTSFIINNSLWLIWYEAVIKAPKVLLNENNKTWCIPLQVTLQYFLVANYFWMFCEGFYLHAIVVFPFARTDDKKLVLPLSMFGWLGPSIPVALYATFRYMDISDGQCWYQMSPYNLFLSIPVGVSLFVSLGFLINILRILVSSMHQRYMPPAENSNSMDITAIRKATKATLLLIPLLGVNYLILPFHPESGSKYELAYEYASALLTSLQGLLVAVIFCFGSPDVKVVFKKRFRANSQSETTAIFRSQ